jgi:hypothetical protein
VRPYAGLVEANTAHHSPENGWNPEPKPSSWL